jgi:hypothetical protein
MDPFRRCEAGPTVRMLNEEPTRSWRGDMVAQMSMVDYPVLRAPASE